MPFLLKRLMVPTLVALLTSLSLINLGFGGRIPAYAASLSANAAFSQAASESGVPVSILKGLCYMEGRLSMHDGSPSIDDGYGCMHLVKNARADTLDQAANLLHVSVDQLKTDLTTNIRGGAAVLHAEALQLSGTHSLPTNVAEWYGEVANYSHSTVHSTALMYADALYKLLHTGFQAKTDAGEMVTLAAQAVTPDRVAAGAVVNADPVPTGCTIDTRVDYPAAVDCLLNPNVYDCTIASPGNSTNPCTYDGANRPTDLAITDVVIHDSEGSLTDDLNIFDDVQRGVSIHYIVDTDGTVYQMIPETAVGFHVGNFWYNQHSIGIEHPGFDATGFQWYNAAQYLGSAKLVAYLLTKYHIPLDREHIVAHGTVPPSLYPSGPNHVDPGPYWMWDYYFDLIHQQGVAFPTLDTTADTIELHTQTHLGQGDFETPADFNFYYLYNGPSTASGLIPQFNTATDITDETNNVEADISYYYLAQVIDPAGTGDTLYEIWYGEDDQVHANPSSQFQDGKMAWLAVPPGVGTEGSGTIVSINESGASQIFVDGDPINGDILGGVPNGALFVSGYTYVDASNTLWYEINFSHRQAWVPASFVTVIHAGSEE